MLEFNVAKKLISNVEQKLFGESKLNRIKAKLSIPYFKNKKFSDRKLNFYFLSTGRVGTRFYSRVLDTATNTRVFHQPSPQLKETVVREVVSEYINDVESFKGLSVSDFPRLEEKILRQQSLDTKVYGDTLNHNFPFGYMLYKYFGPDNLRLVHLIRHPVTCGRSILVSEKDWGNGGRFEELRPPEFLEGEGAAEKTANIWLKVNGMIQDQFEMIDDPSVCKVVRLEDTSLEKIKELFSFLGLEGYEPEKIEPLLHDDSKDVKHSHVSYHDDKEVTKKELKKIARICEPLAKEFGYESSVESALS